MANSSFMTKSSIVILLLLVGCAGRASLGEQATGNNDKLVASEPEGGTSGSTDAGPGPGTTGTNEPITVGDIAFIEADETANLAAPRKMRVDATCRVTDNNGLDVIGDQGKCGQLFAASIDPTLNGACGSICSPSSSTCGVGSIRIHLNDGRDLVRDLAADRCSVTIPSVPTHKTLFWVWSESGGK